MKRFALVFLFLLLTAYIFVSHASCHAKNPGRKISLKEDSAEISRIMKKVTLIKEFIKGKKFNERYCFLVDMNLPSGKNRFFVYDLAKDSIVQGGLVAHGHCNTSFLVKPVFSNQKQSCCTALGKYSVGGGYNGQFGFAYKLHGLDSTNSNAYARNIVLHSYWCIPEEEVYPLPTCNSSGCPMVAPAFLQKLKPYIGKANRPVLLWIFN